MASKDGEITPPQTTTLFPANFENDYVGSDGTKETNAAFLRRMYYMIYYSFFAGDKLSTGARGAAKNTERVRKGDYDDNVGLKTAMARPSTYDESWLDHDEIESQKIIGVGDQEGRFTEISLDQIRRA